LGLTWQIIPTILSSLLNSKELGRAARAMLGMKKLIVQDLLNAFNG
jgi:predicted 3-demethylubiquinone-9 3-methyltransferase (glyoxalase superfamily)